MSSVSMPPLCDPFRAHPPGPSVLVTQGAHSALQTLLDDPLIGPIHVASSVDQPELLRSIGKIRPDAIIAGRDDACSLLAASNTDLRAPVLAIVQESDECAPPHPRLPPSGFESVTLASHGVRLGGLVQATISANMSKDGPRRPVRALVVGPSTPETSSILRSLLSHEPPIAPLMVDSVELACLWLRQVEFDCVILAQQVRDGCPSDCLECTDALDGLAAIGICDMRSPSTVARFVQSGCNDLVPAEDLADGRQLHARVHAAIARARSRAAAVIGENQRLLRLLQDEQEKLVAEARSDRLTNVLNRAAFDDLIRDAHARWEAGAPDYALMLFDVDHFKCINDQLGHSRGDEILLLVARAMSAVVAGHGFLARVGGEEFAVVLEDCRMEQALAFAERVRESVSSASPPGLGLTVSGGVAVATREMALLSEHLYALADSALYRAKRAGRDQIAAA